MNVIIDVFSKVGEYLGTLDMRPGERSGTLIPPTSGNAASLLVGLVVFAAVGSCLATALFPPTFPFCLMFWGVLGLLGGLAWQLIPGEEGRKGPLRMVLLSALAVLVGVAMVGLFFLIYATVAPLR